ncbi:glucosamine 6-phosphate N-acetyltransferase-like [Liolophura sinensis]|uniref:glucosamine 6-phosphate N-acetyltransferase-like n=1 Tax=Liolophura sinensis TaxID=3198878 RepID=UPI003158C63C
MEPPENGCADEYLFDPVILKQIDFSKHKATYKPMISPANPGESLLLRPLCLGDFDRGFLQLLSQLTKVGDISRELFKERFTSMKSCPHTYYVTVLEDTRINQVIGTATLFLEQKFIHTAATRARIEDVVVSDDYRGKQLGKLLLDVLTLLSKKLGSYKVTLDCKDKMIPFYNTFGFTKEEGNNFLQQRFKD